MYKYTHLYEEFLFECDYYDEYANKEIHACALVMAPTMHEAVEAIEKRLPNCCNLHITPYCETQFVWMSQKHYNRLLNDIDGYMFDIPEEEIEIVKCGPEVSKPDFKISDWSNIEVTCDEDKAWEELFNKTINDITDNDDEDYWDCDHPEEDKW